MKTSGEYLGNFCWVVDSFQWYFIISLDYYMIKFSFLEFIFIYSFIENQQWRTLIRQARKDLTSPKIIIRRDHPHQMANSCSTEQAYSLLHWRSWKEKLKKDLQSKRDQKNQSHYPINNLQKKLKQVSKSIPSPLWAIPHCKEISTIFSQSTKLASEHFNQSPSLS